MGMRYQQGVALIVALLILLIVSMMGVTAMKSGLFNERMALNTQAEEMTFQAAETAINGVIAEARKPSSTLVTELMRLGTAQQHCITKAAGLLADACSATAALDARASVQAEATSQFETLRPWIGTDIEVLADYQFYTIGQGDFVATVDMPFENTHYQQWRKAGPGQRQFSVANPSLLEAPAQP